MSEDRNVCPRKFKFFRILFPGIPSKLSIPRQFTKYLIEESSSWATILTRLGKSWHVKLHGDGKGLHFAEGWGRFATAHQLSVGDFLVFKYRGGLIFDVTIFDRTTCEIDYNVINGVANDRVPGEDREREFDCSRKQTSPSCSKRTAKVMEQGTSKHPSGKEEHESQRQDPKTPEMSKRCKRVPCFEVKVRPCRKYCLEISANFRESNDLSSVNQLLLRDPKGLLWPAKLVHCTFRKRIYISGGWRDFHVGNSLEDGDVCIFELIREKNEMHVQIRRRGGLNPMKVSAHGTRFCELDDSERTKRPLYEKGTIFKQKGRRSMGTSVPDPQFTSTIIASNLHRRGYLNIPSSFLSSADLSGVHEVLLVDPNCRRWLVKVHSNSANMERSRMGGGWGAFRDASNLELGDVCIFRFKSRLQRATFKVEVIKSAAREQ